MRRRRRRRSRRRTTNRRTRTRKRRVTRRRTKRTRRVRRRRSLAKILQFLVRCTVFEPPILCNFSLPTDNTPHTPRPHYLVDARLLMTRRGGFLISTTTSSRWPALISVLVTLCFYSRLPATVPNLTHRAAPVLCREKRFVSPKRKLRIVIRAYDQRASS